MNKEKISDVIKNLIDVANTLSGPSGCSWYREQTLFTLQPYLLEEVHELIEAIDLLDSKKIMEELGDVLYSLIFIATLAEKEGRFFFEESIESVKNKLIRRHPHVFDGLKVSSNEEIENNWEEVKRKEGKKTPIDQIPPTLPSLSRAQKVIHKIRKKNHEILKEKISEKIGQELWDLVLRAESEGVDAESALRRTSQLYEEKYRSVSI